MLRGRRVVFFVAFLWYFFAAIPSFAVELGVTATVTLSPIWKQAIEDNTDITPDLRSHQNIAVYTVKTQGVQNMIVPSETVQALFFKNNKLISRQEKITDKNGVAVFTFVYTKSDPYRVIFVDIGHEYPFVIGNHSFSS